MNWLRYLLEANLYLAIFYLVYCLFLNKETYYLLNRIYLLSTSIVAFVLPVIQLGFLKPAASASEATIIIIPNAVNSYIHPSNELAVHYFTMQNCIMGAYLLGVFVFVILLIFKLNRLIDLTKTKPVIAGKQYKLVHINDSNSAFSFFNYLFIGTKALDAEIIIRHELVHIRQKHSIDIILLEVLKIVNWFNPLVYMLQNSLKTVHEYIADEQTASFENDTLAYSSFLVNNAYGISGPSVTHSFFNYNLLKKRIIMLHQKRSGSLARLKYLLTVPVCAGLLCISTVGVSKNYGWVVLSPKKAAASFLGEKVKTLKTTEGASVGYGDKITIHGKIYTVNTLTDADKAYLLKTYKIKLEVVEIKGKPGQATIFFPSTGAKDTNINSANVTTTYTSKGYKFKETGYLINGKSNFRVVITEKNGNELVYFKNSATPAQINLLKEKYGYTFPTMPIYPKMPPPPPMAPARPASDKALPPPPPPIPPAKKPANEKTVSLSTKRPPTVVSPDTNVLKKQADVVLMPPPKRLRKPATNVFAPLNRYIGKYTRYPAVARTNKVMGSVVIQFDLNADHKITNVSLIRGIGNGCDEEAMGVLNNYSDTIDAKAGTYKVAVSFEINGFDAKKTASSALSKDSAFIGEVVIVTML